MKRRKQKILAGKNGSIQRPLRTALLVCFPALACVTKAQEALMPRLEYPVVPPAVQSFQTNVMDVFAPAGTAAEFRRKRHHCNGGR